MGDTWKVAFCWGPSNDTITETLYGYLAMKDIKHRMGLYAPPPNGEGAYSVAGVRPSVRYVRYVTYVTKT